MLTNGPKPPTWGPGTSLRMAPSLCPALARLLLPSLLCLLAALCQVRCHAALSKPVCATRVEMTSRPLLPVTLVRWMACSEQPLRTSWTRARPPGPLGRWGAVTGLSGPRPSRVVVLSTPGPWGALGRPSLRALAPSLPCSSSQPWGGRAAGRARLGPRDGRGSREDLEVRAAQQLLGPGRVSSVFTASIAARFCHPAQPRPPESTHSFEAALAPGQQ